MKALLDDIRRPEKVPMAKGMFMSALLFATGVILGIVSKVLDSIPSNQLPYLLEVLDLRNFFSRLGIWLFFGVLISVYSKSPFRSAVNVFVFFAGMVGSYYLYTIEVLGFFPRSYMMFWVTMTLISPLPAFICWYAKGKGAVSLLISSSIVMVLARQAFSFGWWYFDIRYVLEFIIWLAVIVVLYRSPMQTLGMIVIGIILFMLTAHVYIPWEIA